MPTPLPPSPFLNLCNRFELDVPRFMAKVTQIDDEESPKFLSDPSPEYLTATELLPLVEVLTRY